MTSLEPRLLWAVGILLAVAFLGCSPQAKAPAEPPPPLSARTGLTAASPATLLEVGEDCSQHASNDACAQGLCLRVEAGVPRKAFCTVRCRPADDNGCPNAPTPWSCRQIWPSEEGWVCLPQRSWTGGRATFPGGRVPDPIPRKTFPALDAGQVQ